MKRRISGKALVCTLLVLLICIPSFLPITHVHHDGHTCITCPVCVMAQRLQTLLVQLFFFLAACILLCGLLIEVHTVHTHASRKERQTPVSLKIRMNN